MAMKGLIFDMDGTLLDSMYYWRRWGDMFCEHFGFPKWEALNEIIQDLPLRQIRDRVNEHFGLSYTEEDFEEVLYAVMRPLYRSRVRPKPGILAFLQAAKAKGLQLCVATATRLDAAMIGLEACGLAPYLDFVLTVPQVGRGKEFPDIYQACVRRMGLRQEETVVFEDAGYCVDTLKRAGFSVVGVEDAYTPPAEWAHIAALCDRTVGDYRALLADGFLEGK